MSMQRVIEITRHTSQLDAVDSALLSCSHTDNLTINSVADGVGLLAVSTDDEAAM